MTVARLTKRRNRLEKVHQQVLDDLIGSGLTQAQIAVKYKVAPASISDFVRRHSEEIVRQTREIEERATVYRIAQKEMRIADVQAEYDKVEAWIDEHGLTERVVRWDKDGNEVGETIRLRKDALDTRRALRREVAEELGSLPKVDITLNVQNNVVQLTWGEQVEPLDESPVIIDAQD